MIWNVGEGIDILHETGLMCGIAISTFSKPLTLLIGLLVTGISVSSLSSLQTSS